MPYKRRTIAEEAERAGESPLGLLSSGGKALKANIDLHALGPQIFIGMERNRELVQQIQTSKAKKQLRLGNQAFSVPQAPEDPMQAYKELKKYFERPQLKDNTIMANWAADKPRYVAHDQEDADAAEKEQVPVDLLGSLIEQEDLANGRGASTKKRATDDAGAGKKAPNQRSLSTMSNKKAGRGKYDHVKILHVKDAL